MEEPRSSIVQRTSRLLENEEGKPRKNRRLYQRRPLIFAAVTSLLFSILSTASTIVFFLYGMKVSDPLPIPKLPKCNDCQGPLDGTFEGPGSMSLSIVGVDMHFSWRTTYIFNSSSGMVDNSMVPIENPWPHPITAFDCRAVPFSINSDVCNISMNDPCIRAELTRAKIDFSEVYWDGSDNITVFQHMRGPAGLVRVSSQLVRVATGRNHTRPPVDATRQAT
jgi:hypothetical protein